MKKIFYKNPLFYSFLLPLFMDSFMTLYGQSESYWQNYSSVNEAAPVFILLAYSPFAYLIFEIIWYILVYWLALKLKHPYNLIMSLLFIIGHTYGSTGWIKRELYYNDIYNGSREHITILWIFIILYLLIIAIWSGSFIDLYFKKKYSSK